MDQLPCVLKQSTAAELYWEVPQCWRSISPCIQDNCSQMGSQHCPAGIHISLINSGTCFRPNLPFSNLWLPHFFPHSWLTTLPSIFWGTLSLLHRTLSPTHQQARKPTPALLFLGLFCLLPTKAGSSTWLKTHLFLPCQEMCIIHEPFFL